MAFTARMFVTQFILFILFVSAVTLTSTSAKVYSKEPKPCVQLADVYDKQNIRLYLLSEKYDGIRAIWKDGALRTRNGNIIHAPSWFTKGLPHTWLDGELWYQRGDFEYVASTVSKDKPVDNEWKKITYMVFDAPKQKTDFRSRVIFYTDLLESLNVAHIKPVKQFMVGTNEELSVLLKTYTANGAEGLMLQKADAMFSGGRSGNLLKLKAYMDAEAFVIGHLQGKGKYKNSLGALLVRYQDESGAAIKFKIGSGFSDFERVNPPPIGSLVTFKYHGFTKRGVPRFASYMRIRK